MPMFTADITMNSLMIERQCLPLLISQTQGCVYYDEDSHAVVSRRLLARTPGSIWPKIIVIRETRAIFSIKEPLMRFSRDLLIVPGPEKKIREAATGMALISRCWRAGGKSLISHRAIHRRKIAQAARIRAFEGLAPIQSVISI